MHSVQPDVEIGLRFLRDLAAMSSDPPGFTRASYGPKEAEAHRIAERLAKGLGLSRWRDAAGNLYLELAGSLTRRGCVIGSHLDSVPHGGNFDGAAGVAAGLAIVAGFARASVRPAASIVVMGIRAEESTWFNTSYVGSRAALGRLSSEELEHVRRADTGRRLRDHMREAGFHPDGVQAGRPLIDPSTIAAYIEPHIEQGPVLAKVGAAVGAVTAIRGSFRHRQAVCLGKWDHSGATPREDRRDAVVATADLVAHLDAAWEAALRDGKDLAVTIGQFCTDPSMHAFSKIAGRVEFSLDVRSTSPETLAEFEALLAENVRNLEGRYGVAFDLGPRTASTPALLDTDLQARTAAIATTLGIPHARLASGAGHDCAVFADAGVRSAMVFMRSTGGSHNPGEHLDDDDFAAGTRVVAGLVEGIVR